jgi:bifunctional ADP-heptose synthase (sugar kinase/adenylyltransferase)
MTLFERSGMVTHLDALAHQVFDVTGAGDTVIATLSAAVAAGADLKRAARLANAAAGIVVGNIGTTVITRDDLADFLATHENAQYIHA